MERSHAVSSSSDHPPAGTLLALAWSTEGDEDAMLDALDEGYRLTGNFRGREAEILATARSGEIQ